jgi:hypothetical protein
MGTTEERPAETEEPGDRMDWFRKLYDYFAPVREEAVAKGYTDEEINEWIDQAVREVRAERAARDRRG